MYHCIKVFKNNNHLLIKIFILNQPILISCYTNIIFPKHAFKGYLISHIMQYPFSICSNENDIDQASRIPFQPSSKRNYPKRWSCGIKGKTEFGLKIKQRINISGNEEHYLCM